MAELPPEKIEELLASGRTRTPEDKAMQEKFKLRVAATEQAKRDDRQTIKKVADVERTRRACYDALVAAGRTVPDWQPIEEMHADASPSELLARSTALRDEWKALL
jgi:hypothetical protein